MNGYEILFLQNEPASEILEEANEYYEREGSIGFEDALFEILYKRYLGYDSVGEYRENIEALQAKEDSFFFKTKDSDKFLISYNEPYQYVSMILIEK